MTVHSAKQRCRFCGTGLDGKDTGPRSNVCVTAACRSRLAHEEVVATAERRWTETLRRMREQIADAAGDVIAAARHLNRAPDEVVAVALPLLQRPMVAQRRRDREMMADHLDRIVAESFAAGDKAEVTPDRQRIEAPTSAYVTVACATCKGACCAVGRNYRAFLTAETITRYRRHVPGLSAREIRDDYLDRLPDSIARGSCFFHARQGCTLDREQRDDICNRHLCAQIHAQIDAGMTDAAGPFVMVAADGEGNTVTTLLDRDSGVGKLPPATRPDPTPEEAGAVAEQAMSDFPDRPPGLPAAPESAARVCGWCNRPITPAQAALGGSCGHPACERARRQNPGGG